MKSLHAIAKEINVAAVNYGMRDFQQIRQGIHGLSRPKTRKIFTAQTTHDDWAFHSGGEKKSNSTSDLKAMTMIDYDMASRSP
jgi:hypothetical protein